MFNMMRNKTQKYSQGFVLITVLLIVTLLSALLLGINAELRTEARDVSDWQQSTQVRTAAHSGLNFALAAIREDPDLLLKPESRELFNGRENLILNSIPCTITIHEENGKLNVNRLADKYGRPARTRVDQLLKIIDLHNEKLPAAQRIPYSLAANLIDWIDHNDQTTWLDFVSRDNTGVESTYYQSLQPAYSCANRPFATHRELLLAKDMPKINAAEISADHLLDDLTAYGNGKININTAPAMVLQSLAESMTAPIAQAIISARQVMPFATTGELKKLPGMTETIFQAIQPVITANPPLSYYQVIARATHEQTTRTITAIVKRDNNTDDIRIVYYKES